MCFKMIHFTEVACNKDHEQLGIDVLKVDETKLINFIKAGNNIGLFRGYRVSTHLQDYITQSRKLPIYIQRKVVTKFLKMI